MAGTAVQAHPDKVQWQCRRERLTHPGGAPDAGSDRILFAMEPTQPTAPPPPAADVSLGTDEALPPGGLPL